MKKIIIALVISLLTLHCEPPPEKPEEEDQNLRLENLIYTVAFSSLKVAYQMDVKRRNNILKQVREQLETEREKNFLALKALEERVGSLIQENALLAEGLPTTNKDNAALQIQEPGVTSPPEASLSLEEQLIQLEEEVFGKEDSKGLLFRVQFLQKKGALDSSVSLVLEKESEDLMKLLKIQDRSSDQKTDNEKRLKDLVLFIHGEGDSPGILSKTEKLEETLLYVNLAEEQKNLLGEKMTAVVTEQRNWISEGASIEDRISRLETLIYGTEKMGGIAAKVDYLLFQVVPSFSPDGDEDPS